jgi:hypothetical protein
MSTPDSSDSDGPTPREFVQALLRLSPADAEKARANSPATRRRKPQEGPLHECGDDESEDAK